MKVLSFDVGIKNLAYCLFDQSTTKWKIADWKVVSLLGEEPVIHKCSGENPPKNKKTPAKPCSYLAKYLYKQQHLCDKHAKALATTPGVYLPEPRFKKVKKMKMEELVALALVLKVDSTGKKKPDLLKDIQAYLEEHVLQPVSKSSAKAGDADLITLGQTMKGIFIEFMREHPDVSVVLIENQISPLANRMKTLQGMLAQTFIMLKECIRIEFISSANKLKMFSSKDKKETSTTEPIPTVPITTVPITTIPITTEPITTIPITTIPITTIPITTVPITTVSAPTQSQTYQAHKKDGVTYCHQILEKKVFEGGDQWTLCERKKKDDLADCFLQGVWWLKRENLININTNT